MVRDMIISIAMLLTGLWFYPALAGVILMIAGPVYLALSIIITRLRRG
jgi:hypothetical protein